MAECPFCGAGVFISHAGVDSYRFWAWCNERIGCGAMGPVKPTRDEAMRAFVTVGLAAGVELAKKTRPTKIAHYPWGERSMAVYEPAIYWTETDEALRRGGDS